LVSYSAFWGGVVVPGLLVTALALLPYIDRKRHGVGRWFARERVVANTIFSVCLATAVVFTVIGSFFRGPNWSWVEPWRNPPAVTEGH
jgi:quinol-cytochrome oxidoreductase complex cytochrome b subunit